MRCEGRALRFVATHPNGNGERGSRDNFFMFIFLYVHFLAALMEWSTEVSRINCTIGVLTLRQHQW